MHEFNQSLKYDQRMHAQDIRGSIAYAKSLALRGILTSDEETQIVNGLRKVGEEWATGQFKPAPDDEDIHTANERRLSELIGPLGGKLHTGRSRNDQVATDMRLWLLDQVKEVESALKALITVMVERADKETDVLMPGYTHLQVLSLLYLLIDCMRAVFNISFPLHQLFFPPVALLHSAASQYAGHTFYFLMHFTSETI